jgi:hypothetical protein
MRLAPYIPFEVFCSKMFPGGIIGGWYKPEDPEYTKWVPMGTAREFYDDYKCSGIYPLEEYVRITVEYRGDE